MSRTSDIQQLYIGLLGRAADADGLAYWAGTGLSTAEIAKWIVEDAPEFPRGEREAAVKALYQNLFNREPEAEGLNYWVNESQVSIDELVVHLIEWASPKDATTLNNRTFVADAYTQTSGQTGYFSLEAAKAAIAGVDHTWDSVSNALDDIDGYAFNVVAGIDALAVAQDALEDFLDDNDTTAVAITTELATAFGDFNFDWGTALAAGSNQAQRDTAYNAARADAQHALTNAQTAVGALDADKVAAYQAAKAAAAAAADAFDASKVAEAGAVAEYNQAAANAAKPVVNYGDLDTTDPAAIVLGGEWGNIATLNTDGAINVLEVAPTAAGNPGIAAMIAAVNARIAAEVADDKADTKLTAAGADLGAGVATLAALETAQEDVSALEEQIAEVEAAYGLSAELAVLQGAITAASDNLTDNGYVIQPALAGNATGGNDIYLYDDVGGTIGNFGVAGNDSIYFGTEYTLVAIGEGQAYGDNLGSASALEIFWQDVGGNLTLYVEELPTAGNGTGLQDLSVITLTGFDGDFTFVNGLFAAA